MFALFHASVPSVCCGNYAAASAFLDELVRLADEKGALFWKALGMLMRGYSLALTDKTSDAVQITTSGSPRCGQLDQQCGCRCGYRIWRQPLPSVASSMRLGAALMKR
jgi:hypothetical protein